MNITEAALLSDSDGFPAYLGDFPPPEDEVDKDEIMPSAIYYMHNVSVISRISVFTSFSVSLRMLSYFLPVSPVSHQRPPTIYRGLSTR